MKPLLPCGRGARRALLCLGLTAAASRGAFAAPPEPGPAFTLDLDRFRAIDPALRLWTERSPIRVGWTNLAGVAAAPDGSILAVGDRTLARFDAGGRKIGSADLPEAARCVAAAADGTVAVGLTRQMLVFDANLSPMAEGPELSESSWITSIAVHGDRIAAADAGQRMVWLFDRAGRLVRHLTGSADVGFVVPSPHLDVLFDPDGLLWVVNPGEVRVEAYSADGVRLRHWGRPGFGIGDFVGCCNPTDIALLPNGSFVTAEKGIVRIKVARPDGSVESVVAGPDDFDADTVGLDLATDAAGRIFVADPKRRLIRIFVRK